MPDQQQPTVPSAVKVAVPLGQCGTKYSVCQLVITDAIVLWYISVPTQSQLLLICFWEGSVVY